MNSRDEQKVIDTTITILEMFNRVTPNDVYQTMISAIAELLLDGELPSLNWYSRRELDKMNSLEGVQELERLLFTKANENRDEVRSCWEAIISKLIIQQKLIK